MSSLIKGNDTQKSYEEMSVAVLMVDDFIGKTALLDEILNQNYQLRY